MPKEIILVVEDEEDILELIRYNLSREGYGIIGVTTGEEGLRIAGQKKPDLIILDLMLPGIDGLDVCRQLKEDPHSKEIPIVMVTAKGEESDIVTGLELGAEDYITKPFSPKVLIARIRSILRRRTRQITDENATISTYGIFIHPGRHEVLVDGEKVPLTSTEFKVLHFLARRPGWVFTRYQIVDGVHGDHYPVTDRSVDVQITGLRKKLGNAGKFIQTVRGVGYKFEE
jgi:two-component system phosphate regulon response regulator PhoB